jgi:uncharacterized protein YecT (DUF1311 family)
MSSARPAVEFEFIHGMDTVGMQPATAGTRHHPTACIAGVHGACIALAVAAGLLALPGCPARQPPRADAQALATSPAPLAWTVNAAHITPRIATASMETRQAAPGYQFVVLDVSVRNRDDQPQVLSEGSLVAMDESDQRTFDQPETLLSPDYLSLQVLAPSQRLRGKIAFEVPAPLSGVLFWSPGNSSERILLNPHMPLAARALADADDDRAPATDVAPAPRTSTRDGASPASSSTSTPTTALATQNAFAATVRAAQRTPPQRARAPRDAGHATRHAPAAQVATADTPSPAQRNPALSLSSQALPRELAPATSPAPAPAMGLPGDMRSIATASSPQSDARIQSAGAGRAHADGGNDHREQARTLACEGLVSRDDPAEKASQLGFFAQSCRDYALPPSWQPPPAPRRSLLARASDLVARVVLRPRVTRISDCSTAASRADRLVCGDPALSAMDQQLAQSVSRAREGVDDPRALQREQAAWHEHVRNACRSERCLQRAYGRRIGQLDALASARR